MVLGCLVVFGVVWWWLAAFGGVLVVWCVCTVGGVGGGIDASLRWWECWRWLRSNVRTVREVHCGRRTAVGDWLR